MSKSPVPEEALNKHIAILGKTGAGKSFTAKGIVERLLRERRQVCVLDPTAAWWGLRLAADGKGKGLDVVLIGGKHGDLPLSERSGEAVARLVTQQRASVVIDTSGMTVGEYTRWFIAFAGTLYTSIRSPLHLVIDEAHYFMPQGGGGRLDVDAGRMLHAGNRLMSGGRSLGIRGIMITQRPAKLHKDSLTCADTLIAMRVMAPQDRAAIKEWVDGAGDPVQGKTVLDSLAQLQRGEGWVWYPEAGYLERTKFPAIKTYDSSATPEHGAAAASPDVSAINLEEVKEAMAEAVREAEANDPELLRRKIADLEKKLRERPPETKIVKEVERVEVPVLANGQLDKALTLVNRLEGAMAAVGEIAGSLTTAIGRATAPDGAPWKPQPYSPRQPNRPAAPPRPEPSYTTAMVREHVGALSGPEQRILDAIAWLESIGVNEPEQTAVAFLAGYTIGGGGYNNPRGSLRSKGLIDYRGINLALTDAGRALANVPTGVLTTDGLHRKVMERLPGPERKILQVLLDAYPNSVPYEDLARQAGYEAGGGGFNNPRGRLRSLGLIDYPSKGEAAARSILFLEG